MFLAKTSSPNEWKTVAATIATLVEEATFEATAEGLSFRAMDPSHVALVDLFWPNSAFEKYECDKQLKFSVRVEDFVKLIKRAEAQDAVEITTGEAETLLLRIMNGYKREYNLHLIEATAGATPLPRLAFKAKIQTTEGTFERILNDIAVVSDHITIEAAKDSVLFTGKSDTGSVKAVLEKGSEDMLTLEVAEESKATYSIEYLLNIVKAAGTTSQTLALEFAGKMPIKLAFKLGEAGGKIDFFLAPRVDER